MHKSVIFIIINVIIERYAWTGTTNILVIYLNTKLGFDEGTSTALFHAVNLLTYIFPIIAAIFADSYYGLFNTLIFTSMIFIMGSLIMAIGAIESLNLPMAAFTLTGMFLFVAIGGPRSCLATFGADQYNLPKESEQLKTFFFLHMFFVKFGALLGRFVNPILREDVQCLGNDSCYPLAFGFPGIVMIMGILILLFTRKHFVRKPTGENMLVKVSSCVLYSIKAKIKYQRCVKKDHWLDYAEDKYDIELIKATKVVSSTMTIFLGISIFWSAFMQQNSRWIFQAAKMNGDFGFYRLKPDQIIAFNPISALILTPLCNFYVYPLLSKCGFGSLLNRMTIGGFVCAASFVVATIVEVYIKDHYISMLWLLPQYVLSAISEIFVLVSLLNFAYSEAPGNMKSVMSAMVYLTTALGDSLTVIISGSKVFKSQAVEFGFFAGLLFVNMIVFCFLAKRYESNHRKNENKALKK